MLIDGLIKFCNEKSKNIKLKAEPQVFIEIAEKLEELKAIKSDGFTDHLLNMGYSKGYNKAIDEFAEKLNTKIREFVLEYKDNLDFASGISVAWNMVDEIAEQLKGSGK